MRKKSRYFRIFFRLTQRSRIAIQQNKTLFIHVSSFRLKFHNVGLIQQEKNIKWRGKIKKKGRKRKKRGGCSMMERTDVESTERP